MPATFHVICPTCGAMPGQPCYSGKGPGLHRVMKAAHPKRIKHAEDVGRQIAEGESK